MKIKHIFSTLLLMLLKLTTFSQVISTVAGSGTAGFSGDGSAATSAKLQQPYFAVTSNSVTYIADAANYRIRKVASNGIISTYVGTGTQDPTGFTGNNGAATSAKIGYIQGMAVDASGNLYISDISNNVIRKISTTGTITTIAGTGTAGYSGDGGAATSAKLSGPTGIAFDSSGDLYICDSDSSIIRKITISTGIISTYAGKSSTGAYTGDGGNKNLAKFDYPRGIAIDALSNVYIADYNNNRIRKITSATNIITTYAGNGIGGFSGDGGLATSAQLNNPTFIALDNSGFSLFISDFNNNRIRRVTISNNIINTYAGNGSVGYNGDGKPAIITSIYAPNSVTFDNNYIYIADTYNHRIRKVTNCSTPLNISITGASSVCKGNSVTLTANNAVSYNWSSNTGGATTSAVVVSPTVNTTYTVVGDDGICAGTAIITVSVNALPTLSLTAAATSICAGTNAILNVAGANTYNWSANAGNSTLNTVTVSPSSFTTYSVVGTGANFCTKTSTISVGVYSLPNVLATINTNTICSGSSANVNATGASTYTWSANAGSVISNSISVFPLSTSTYTVIGADLNGCKNSASVSLSVTATPTLSVNSSTICESSSTILTVSGAATYSWSANASSVNTNTVSLSPTVTTTFSVVGTANNCSASTTATIHVNSIPSLSVTASSSSICIGSAVVLNVAGANTYVWSANAGSSSINTVTVSPSSFTTYSVVGTGTNSCTKTGTINVAVNSLPTVSASVNTSTICSGNTATLNATGAVTYTWSANAAGATSSSVSVQPSTTSNYSVIGTDINGCTNNSSITLSVTATPTLTVNSSTICESNSTVLTANGASSFTWSANAGSVNTNTVSLSPTINTTYSVVGVSNNCIANTTATVNVNSTPNLSVTANSSTICIGNSVVLNVAGGNTYVWSANAGSSSLNTVTVAPSVSTIYSVTGTGINLCSSSKTLEITVNNLPNIVLTSNTSSVCLGSSSILTANGATTYTWSSNASSSIFNSVTVTPLVNSTFTATGTDINGCQNSNTISVVVVALPSVLVNNPSICLGDGVILSGSGANSYTWSTGSNSSSISVSPPSNSTYTLTGENTTTGCVKSVTSNVTVNQLPNVFVNATSTVVCFGNSIVLSGAGAQTYSWTGAVSNGTSFNPINSQSYTVTGVDLNNCVNSATIQVNVNSLPTVSVNSQTICNGSQANLSVDGANTYTWSNNQSGSVIFVNPTSTTSYTVTGTDNNNCANTAIATVVVPDNIAPEICMVTTDSVSNYNFNIIYWDKAQYAYADSFIVYRYDALFNTYLKIGTVTKDSTSMMDTARYVGSSFGTNGNPNYTAYKYTLAIKDTCGNISAQSPYHLTEFLQSLGGGNFSISQYDISSPQFNPVTGYALFRDDFNTGVFTNISTIASGATSVTDPNFALFPNANYRIDILGFNCYSALRLSNINKIYSTRVRSHSNATRQIQVTLIKESEKAKIIDIYPNPANNLIYVTNNNDANNNCILTIYDATSRVIIQRKLLTKTTEIDLQNLESGLYFIEVNNTRKPIIIIRP